MFAFISHKYRAYRDSNFLYYFTQEYVIIHPVANCLFYDFQRDATRLSAMKNYRAFACMQFC